MHPCALYKVATALEGLRNILSSSCKKWHSSYFVRCFTKQISILRPYMSRKHHQSFLVLFVMIFSRLYQYSSFREVSSDFFPHGSWPRYLSIYQFLSISVCVLCWPVIHCQSHVISDCIILTGSVCGSAEDRRMEAERLGGGRH